MKLYFKLNIDSLEDTGYTMSNLDLKGIRRMRMCLRSRSTGQLDSRVRPLHSSPASTVKKFSYLGTLLTILAVLSIILATPAAAATISILSYTLTNYGSGAIANCTITFTIPTGSNLIDSDKVQCDFPAGFNLTNSSVMSLQYYSGGSWSNLLYSSGIAAQSVTITRTGNGTLNAGTQIRTTLNSITNPGSAGTYIINLTTRNSSGAAKDTGSDSVIITLPTTAKPFGFMKKFRTVSSG